MAVPTHRKCVFAPPAQSVPTPSSEMKPELLQDGGFLPLPKVLVPFLLSPHGLLPLPVPPTFSGNFSFFSVLASPVYQPQPQRDLCKESDGNESSLGTYPICGRCPGTWQGK